MSSWIVYRHTCPSGNVYIGITTKSPEKRYGKDGNGYKNCPVFKRAIKKYGWNNIKHEVLFSNLSEEKAKELEINLIRHYKGLGISYNVTDGGDGALGRIPSETTRALMRARKINKPLPEEHRQKIVKAMQKWKGVPRSEETKLKLHLANKGKKPSPQTLEALKKYHKEHPLSTERLDKMIEGSKKAGHVAQAAALNRNREQIGIKHRKPIVQLSETGIYLNTYDASKFAAQELNIDNSSIVRCCKGKQVRAGNYFWLYLSEYEKYIKEGTIDNKIQELICKASYKPGTYVRTAEWRRRKSEEVKRNLLLKTRLHNCENKVSL